LTSTSSISVQRIIVQRMQLMERMQRAGAM
jgi:hypothetical protein